MVPRIIEFDTVRVAAIHGSAESHLAINDCLRPPAIGDLGTVVHLTPTYNPGDPNTRFIVESNEGQADLVWLAEFSREELEFVSRPHSVGKDDSAGLAPEIFERLRAHWLSDIPTHDIYRRYVEERGVLPLASDMGGLYALTRSGEILEFEWDNINPLRSVHDPRLVNVALFQGAARYPELTSLLPQRPDDALPCGACHGTGKVHLPEHLQDKVVCYCGGAGWLPAGTPQFGSIPKPTKRWWQFWRP